MKIFINRLANTAAIAGGLVTISDIAQPLAPISAYVTGASAIAIIILIGARFITSQWNETMATATFFAGGLFILSSLLYWFQSTQESFRETGIIASQITIIEKLQRDAGMLPKIAKDLESIDKKIDKLKKETSEDPRKEIGNLGLRWSTEDFAQALAAGDLEVIELFLQGGINMQGANHLNVGVNVARRNRDNPGKVAHLLNEYGYGPLYSYRVDSSHKKKNAFVLYAIQYDNETLFEALAEIGFDAEEALEHSWCLRECITEIKTPRQYTKEQHPDWLEYLD